MTASLKILQISPALRGGGAEGVARDLHRGLRDRGHAALLAVGSMNDDAAVPGTLQIPFGPPTGAEARLRRAVTAALAPAGSRSAKVGRIASFLSRPGGIRRRLDRVRGREVFEYPGSRALLDLLPFRPDVIHVHNLHGGYFDLRTLPRLSEAAPLVITLHDEWLLTGHCAYSMGCERWREGCGSCPDLTIYPELRRDGTATNHRIKRSIYQRSSYGVSAPSDWLLERSRRSILAEGATSFRLIRNGIDRDIFHASARGRARDALGIPDDAAVLLFAANLNSPAPFKDPHTVVAAARRIGGGAGSQHVIMISIGKAGPTQRHGPGELRQLAYEKDRHRLAEYYRVADLYVHAAHADNAPLTIAEALASGTPTVATAVGGIPEMIRSLEGVDGAWAGSATSIDEATGVLVPPHDAEAMAAAAASLLAAPETLARLSANAATDAVRRFSLETQLDETEDWYRDVTRAFRQARGRALS